VSRLTLVTGAAGEMGRRLVLRLRERGLPVRALVLPGDPLRARLDGLGCQIVEGDLRDPAALAAAAAGADTVFHLAAVILARDPAVLDAVNRQGTANMVAAAGDAGVRHFVYVSSASVTYPRLTPYGRSKLAAEQTVRAERRFAFTIVRPTLVYERDGGQEFMLFVRHLQRFPVVPFIGPGTARKSPVLADDVVEGLCRIAGNPVSFGKTYNLSGGEAVTLAELGRLVLAQQGRRKPFVHVPAPLCAALAVLLGLVMKDPPLTPYAVAGFVNHADLDPGLAAAELGYHPLGVRAGIARCFSPPAPNQETRRAS
jgi:nucleoside-diphosphate-sugar epimerase